MTDQYPLYPELSEAGKEEAQALIEKFKVQLKKAFDNVLSDMYTDIVVHIESDSWTNYRNHMLDGFKNYNNRKIQGEYDFKEIRQAILRNHREDIIEDLNQDMVKEIEDLKETIEILQGRRLYP